MSNEKNIAIVRQIYADVVAKNLEGFLASLTDDIKWEPPFVPVIPHTKPRSGKKEVTNWVIEMAGEVTYTQVTPQDIYADNNAVIVKGIFEGKANSTGKSFQSDWVHIWKLRDGRVFHYQAFWNTYNVAISFH